MITNRVAALRALVDHIEKHDLPMPLTIKCEHDGRIQVHLYAVSGTAAWIGTLAETSAEAIVHGDNVHVLVNGLAADLAVEVIICLTDRNESAERDAMLAVLPDPESTDRQPVELPEFLTGVGL